MNSIVYNGLKLAVGDEVFWNDPDSGLCSDYFHIIEFLDFNVVRLSSSDGSELEAFLWELE